MNDIKCPGCGRTLQRRNTGRYARHSVTARSCITCPLSELREIVTGQTHHDDERRAKVIAELAEIVQDEDPSVAWIYLGCLPEEEKRRMLMFALAAIPVGVGKSVDDIWAWITQLPVAQAVTV